MNTNKPMPGLVVLEIICSIFINKISSFHNMIVHVVFVKSTNIY